MSASAIVAIVVFGVLFLTWVILPTVLKKRHHKVEAELKSEK